MLDAVSATRVEETTTNTEADTEQNSDVTESTEEKVNVITIKSITVDTFGVDYGVPEVVNNEDTMDKVNAIYNQYFGGNTNAIVTE